MPYLPKGRVAQTQSVNCGRIDRCHQIGSKTASHFQRPMFPLDLKHPFAWTLVGGSNNATVLAQFKGMRWSATAFKVGRRAEHDAPQRAQASGSQAGIRQIADPYCQIEALGIKVDKSVGELEVNLDLRMHAHVVGNDRYYEIRAEQNWRAHAQDARWFRSLVGGLESCVVYFVDGGFDAVEKRRPSFAWCRTARRSLYKLDPDGFLQRRQRPADRLQ